MTDSTDKDNKNSSSIGLFIDKYILSKDVDSEQYKEIERKKKEKAEELKTVYKLKTINISEVPCMRNAMLSGINFNLH
jgi:hypothetical protein